jgi:hypothetical protein
LGLGDFQRHPIAVLSGFDLRPECLVRGPLSVLDSLRLVLGAQPGLELGAGLDRAGFGATRRAALSLAEQAHSRPPPGIS